MSSSPIRIVERASPHESLLHIDEDFPRPQAVDVLLRSENAHLLQYVVRDPFGSHVFPGTTGCSREQFLQSLQVDLEKQNPYFLWATIPLCKYHCHFCQFPIVVSKRDAVAFREQARHWVDQNIAEARLWLAQVPALRDAPVGEFCLFGGTPTLLPDDLLAELLDFYQSNFGFNAQTTIRIEGSPDSLTSDKLALLLEKGCTKITYGIQSFDGRLVALAGREHTADEAMAVVRHAFRLGFERVDGDLIYGLLGQSVEGFCRDVQQMLELGYSTVVMTKLHLRPFGETGTAIAGVPARWQSPAIRERMTREGHRWPSLGAQYQMREAAVTMLEDAGLSEYPTMYFQKPEIGCGRWKALVLDQDRQFAEVGIGLGASSAAGRCSASIATQPGEYLDAISKGDLPLLSLEMSHDEEIAGSIRRALTTCQPIRDDLHRTRFAGSSIFDQRWKPVFQSLKRRGLATMQPSAGTIALTSVGKTLVEAIVNTEIR
ncbi:radical SAM protein [Burkholderia ubonensis]|uniref:radical SAM protein n=1 Tax=Burkholderia ubonensis TaxID=101571 RepID=UPI00076D7AA4|nr:radical SAM protein [Burkholderia ubonensis]KWO82400.1 radical SAM protein [Burkholderia ubonensis]